MSKNTIKSINHPIERANKTVGRKRKMFALNPRYQSDALSSFQNTNKQVFHISAYLSPEALMGSTMIPPPREVSPDETNKKNNHIEFVFPKFDESSDINGKDLFLTPKIPSEAMEMLEERIPSKSNNQFNVKEDNESLNQLLQGPSLLKKSRLNTMLHKRIGSEDKCTSSPSQECYPSLRMRRNVQCPWSNVDEKPLFVPGTSSSDDSIIPQGLLLPTL